MVGSLVVVLAFLGLAIDVGYIELLKEQMQTAADAGALSGGRELKANGTANVASVARTDTAKNGFTNGANGVTVTVNTPPGSGYYTSDNTGVEVIVSQTVNTFFMSLVGTSSLTVSARSVVHEGSGTACLYTLDPSASKSLDISGGSTRVSANCGVNVASSSADAVDVSGGATLTASSVSINGNYNASGGSTITPSPVTGVAAPTDPLAYLTPPPVGACNQTHYTAPAGAPLSPGVYCNGLTISGTTNTLNSGTYIILGGGLTISGGATVTGNNVLFYNTYNGTWPYRPIDISGGSSVTLTAPSTGSLAGMLFFQDRTAPTGGGTGSTISGGSDLSITGTLYFPTTTLTYSGGSSGGGAYTNIVAKDVVFSGGSTLNNDYSSLPNGSPIKGGALLSE